MKKQLKTETKITSTTAKIRKDMNLAEVVFKYPKLAEVLLDYGLHCVGCAANSFDTIEMGSRVHGMTDEEINDMVVRLNEVVDFKE
ncbi:MAG TPA: DUF1858 domain-containing protein [Candidatus Saccharimonadales bacterium]|nr:DUF1858 domain-containing protein [Candidatus Saccharimonadales bacterium]